MPIVRAPIRTADLSRFLGSSRAFTRTLMNPELNTGGHTHWTLADSKKFRAYWLYGTKQRLGFELQSRAGTLSSDTRKFGSGNVDQKGWLNSGQEKLGSEVSVPMKRSLPRPGKQA